MPCFSSRHSQYQPPLVLLQVQVLQQRDLHQRPFFRELVRSRHLPAAPAGTALPAAAASQPQPGKRPPAVSATPSTLVLQRGWQWWAPAHLIELRPLWRWQEVPCVTSGVFFPPRSPLGKLVLLLHGEPAQSRGTSLRLCSTEWPVLELKSGWPTACLFGPVRPEQQGQTCGSMESASLMPCCAGSQPPKPQTKGRSRGAGEGHVDKAGSLRAEGRASLCQQRVSSGPQFPWKPQKWDKWVGCAQKPLVQRAAPLSPGLRLARTEERPGPHVPMQLQTAEFPRALVLETRFH